jgi:hypothetical protein
MPTPPIVTVPSSFPDDDASKIRGSAAELGADTETVLAPGPRL